MSLPPSELPPGFPTEFSSELPTEESAERATDPGLLRRAAWLALGVAVLFAAYQIGWQRGTQSATNEIYYDDVDRLNMPRVRSVVTPLDHHASGRYEVAEFLSRQSEAERAAWEASLVSARASVVRVEVTPPGGASPTKSGSGVRLDTSRVVTAAALCPPTADATAQTYIASADGRRSLAPPRIDSRSVNDRLWRVLEAPAVSPSPPTEVATPALDERVLVLGYPDRVGVNRRDQIAYEHAQERLAPVEAIAEVIGLDPLRLSLRAGAVPFDGMAGGAIFNSTGQLIGIVLSTNRSSSRIGAEYELEGCTLEGIESASTTRSTR